MAADDLTWKGACIWIAHPLDPKYPGILREEIPETLKKEGLRDIG
jgi:hypothetical protein